MQSNPDLKKIDEAGILAKVLVHYELAVSYINILLYISQSIVLTSIFGNLASI